MGLRATSAAASAHFVSHLCHFRAFLLAISKLTNPTAAKTLTADERK